jgi:hypothetical protein
LRGKAAENPDLEGGHKEQLLSWYSSLKLDWHIISP